MQMTTFHILPIHSILYKYVHKYILHTTAKTLKRGEMRAQQGEGSVYICICFECGVRVCMCVCACAS